MATLTIRSVPDDVVERIKQVAERNGRSMEQEVREVLKQRFASRRELLDRIHQEWKELPKASREEIDAWIDTGRE